MRQFKHCILFLVDGARPDVVELFRENGSINKQHVAKRLQRRLHRVHRHLEHGRYYAALLGLRIFKFQVRFQTLQGGQNEDKAYSAA